MDIKNRLAKLELQLAKKVETNAPEVKLCTHPANSMTFYQDYSFDDSIVQKFKCISCGFQDFVFTHYDLDEIEAELLNALDFWAQREALGLLAKYGFIKIAAYPATDQEKQNCLKWSAMLKANDTARKDFIEKWLVNPNADNPEQTERLTRGYNSLIEKLERAANQ